MIAITKIYSFKDENEIENYKINGLDKLTKFNNFTSTNPAFRCNLEINSDKGGFSSYQSEYPFNMINKKRFNFKSCKYSY